ncbi:hypothetical protein D3C78_1415590 [compost metagenome]
MREILRQLGDFILHQLIGLQLIGTGGQLDVHAGGLHAVIAAEIVIVFATQFDGGNIAKRD